MTLFEAQPYDPARARRKWRRIIAAVCGVIFIGILWWLFRFWPEEHIVDQFFDALQQQNFEKAYGVWMHDPDWKQHPERYKNYSFGEFHVDWGPGGEWGLIKEHQIDGSVRPKNGSGVVVQVTVNHRADKARIWVEKKDKTLTFSPF